MRVKKRYHRWTVDELRIVKRLGLRRFSTRCIADVVLGDASDEGAQSVSNALRYHFGISVREIRDDVHEARH